MNGVRGWATVAAVATLVAVAGFLVRSDLREYSTPVDEPQAVAPGHPVSVTVSSALASAAEPKLRGTFTLESLRSFDLLTPFADAFDDPIGRKGGRVVVATLSCECAVSEDFRRPTLFAIDDTDRRWESIRIDASSYPDLAGLLNESDLGEQPTVRFAAVFVVPAKVADAVDVIIDPTVGDSVRLLR